MFSGSTRALVGFPHWQVKWTFFDFGDVSSEFIVYAFVGCVMGFCCVLCQLHRYLFFFGGSCRDFEIVLHGMAFVITVAGKKCNNLTSKMDDHFSFVSGFSMDM